jgi:hypothetical protein
MTPAAHTHPRDRLPALRFLDLTRCVALRDGALRALAASPAAPRLEELILYADAQFSAPALAAALAAAAPSLRRLDLCGAGNLTDDALLALLTPHAEGGGADGADAAETAAAGAALRLPMRVLNLTWCPLLSDASLVPLLAACPALEWLSLHGLTGYGPRALESLVASGAAAATLHTLDVRGCTGVPAAERTPAALRARMPHLRVFKVHS